MNKKDGQIYTLDAALAASIILLTIFSLIMIRSTHVARLLTPPEEQLAMLLSDLEFLNALYMNDTIKLSAIVSSYISAPFNLTVYSVDGVKIFSIGQPVEGVAAVTVIPGWNGTLSPRLISLKVRGERS